MHLHFTELKFLIWRKKDFFVPMSLVVASIASGSNGNCYFVGNNEEGILVDVGISCKELDKRMQRMGLGMQQVKAIFISHEHADHICGLATTSKKYGVPVYITQATLRNSRTFIPKEQIHFFRPNDTIQIGKLGVTAFSKMHDAAEPCSFIINHNNTTVGVLTDIGTACTQVMHYFRQCHAVFLESNYDEAMLFSGSYPYYLKNRIHGSHGHLSNRQALQLFLEHKSPALSHLFLSHLSKNNNCPKLVHQLFQQHAGGVQVSVASRYEEGPLYRILGSSSAAQRQQPVFATPIQPQLAFSFE